jgi:hypothetical protein
MAGRESRVLTRRQAMLAAGAATATGLGSTAPDADAHGVHVEVDDSLSSALLKQNSLVGILSELVGRQEFLLALSTNDKEPTRVRIASGARVYREQPGDITDFDIGDEVAMEGAWEADGSFRADYVEPLHRILEAQVLDRTRDTLRTDQGLVHLSSSTRPRGGSALDHVTDARALLAIRPGERIIVCARKNALTGTMTAVTVGSVVG